ncbi:MAG: formylglycine-generating enzyme family protein [Synechococcaceae cyanobacterium]
MARSPTSPQATGRSFPFLLTHRRRSQGYREALTPELSLTMLWIPPGRFWMGSPPEEPDRSDAEGPQRLVQLQGFFLGQTPVTQAQWRAVAQWQPRDGERWGQELQANPSRFQAKNAADDLRGLFGKFRLLDGETSTDQRPVERVSWHDAMEFCNRLSQRFGRHYTLPSEAQWEYACRAGTTTPFHFGDTISAKLANYVATVSYGDGPTGEYREQTTSVASFPANGWGLYDMHGNVWEWCSDHWHASYEGAPENDRGWIDENADKNSNRLLRGGSWDRFPRLCRSAYRVSLHPRSRDDHVGFRVCCLP